MLTPTQVLSSIDAPFTFQRRPVPVPGELRASWKMLLVVAMLDRCCRRARSSLRRLHVLNWATRSEKNAQALLAALEGSTDPTTVLVRLDPSLNRAIDRARGVGLVHLPSGDRVVLAAPGVDVARTLDKSDVLGPELNSLSSIGHRLSERKTTDILQWYAR